ncbi:hypothetical protein [Actinoplanes sp. NPDC020271]|uniref:hypothetical protein n=1 Tax=Actinoplanes sp. NPDC020271 TaxID=3363896 RepID=UPI003788D1D4
MKRRDFAVTALSSLTILAVPLDRRQTGSAQVAAVREVVEAFSRADERFGGGHARPALERYLDTEVAARLRGGFARDTDRRAMTAAAAELTYLAGWKAFDSGAHEPARRHYLHALRLAEDAGDRALTGFVLRAMAHQAVDRGHGQAALDLASAARSHAHGHATPAATALFTILTARGHAATGDRVRALAAIRAAEALLGRSRLAEEPGWIRTSGFTGTSLASQAGQALRDLGDLAGAEERFRTSIATRDGRAYPRIHALTCANLADVQHSRGRPAEAVATWHLALDALPGVTSGRARAAVAAIRQRLREAGPRLPAYAQDLDRRVGPCLGGASIAA